MRKQTERMTIELPFAWEVSIGIRERLGTDLVGRQRAVVDETVAPSQPSPLLLVLHEVPDRSPERLGLFFWRSVDGVWKVYGQGENYDDREDGIAALHEHMARYEEEERYLRDAYERAGRAEQYLTILEEAALQSHATSNLYRTMADARMLMRERKIEYDVEIINARDRAYNIEREFALLYTDTQNALDYREAHAVEVLNVLFLIFFPLTIIATVFETGIIQQILDTTPTLDPLVLTIALLIAALLIGIGFYLLISPLQRQPRRSRRRIRGNRKMPTRAVVAAPGYVSPPPQAISPQAIPPRTMVKPSSATAYQRHPLRRSNSGAARTLGKQRKQYQIEEEQK